MIKVASTWLEGLQRQRIREGRPRISTWDKLKKHLRRKYVPPTYRHQLYMRFSTLTQGNKSVQDYLQEWEKLTVLCEVNEMEDLRVSRFIAGLKEDIREKMLFNPQLTVHAAGNLAIEIEKSNHRKRQQTSTTYTRNSRTFTPRNQTPNNTVRKDSGGTNQKPNPTRPEAPLKDIVCFKCNGRGHYKKDCPNARTFTLREWEDIRQDTRPKKILITRNGQEEETYLPTPRDEPDGTYIEDEEGNLRNFEGDTESDEEMERVLPEEEQYNLISRRVFHTTPRVKKSDQRENIFQTKCRVRGRVCDLIIDGGSESNCVSKQLVTELGLQTKPHPHPYKMRWLDNKASGAVDKQCLVSVTLGTYTDDILCDVLEMDACHLLLGRPWQYDRRTKHNGYTNTYTLRHEGKKKELVPLPPHKSVPPKATKPPVHLMTRKECAKEIEETGGVYVLFTRRPVKHNPYQQS